MMARPNKNVTVSSVMLFLNGMVLVFDQNGRQIPKLQGRFTEVVTKVLQAANAGTKFSGWPDIEDGGHIGDWRCP